MRRFLALILFLAGCQFHSGWNDQWSYHSLKENHSCISKLKYRSRDPICGIGLELIKTDGLVAALIDVPGKVQEHEGRLLINEELVALTCSAHRGGQRLRISQDQVPSLIEAFKQGDRIEIQLGGFKEEFETTGFARLYSKLTSPPQTKRD